MLRRMSSMALLLLVASLALVGCQRTVEVQSGTRVECIYGHPVSDDVAVKKVPASEAGEYSVSTVNTVCPRHLQAERLYEEAQSALAAGDMKTAEKKLAQVVAIDKAFRRASDQLAEAQSGRRPAADQETTRPAVPDEGGQEQGGGTAKPPTVVPGEGSGGNVVGPQAGLLVWAPDTLAGFVSHKPTSDPYVITRVYTTTSGPVEALTAEVEQMVSADAVKSALAQRMNSAYGKDRRTAKVGDFNATLGTDGNRYAALALADGAVFVTLEMRTRSGAPSALLDDLERVAKAMPGAKQ